MPVYLIGAIEIEDQQEYDRYLSMAGASMTGYRIESLSVDDNPVLFEGQLPANRIIIMRFETEEEMSSWYHSAAYQAAAKHRNAGAKTQFLVAVRGGYSL